MTKKLETTTTAPGHTSTEDVRNCIEGMCHCDARNWLLTEGNQYFLVGEIVRVGGELRFVNDQRDSMPLPMSAVVRLMKAYADSRTRVGRLRTS